MSKIHKILLKQKSGLLSELQSDTIFGHFCWRLKEKFGDKTLEEFLSHYLSSEPVFAVSNGMLENEGTIYFNKPKMQTPFKYKAKNKAERIKDAILYKELKSREYITLDQLNLFLNNQVDEYNKSFEGSEISPSMYSEVRVNVQIDRKTAGSAEGKLFNLSPSYSRDQSLIAILIKEIDEDAFQNYRVVELMRAVFETGYGKKKSSGFGEFKVETVDQINDIEEPVESKGFISFSNYLPSNEDRIIDAYYDLNIKYGKFGEGYANLQNPFKKPILFLMPGSCFKTDEKKDFYGRCTENSEISDYMPQAVQNGIAFTLNFGLGSVK